MNILEVWIDLPGTNGQYQVSNCGHIRLMFRKAKSHRRGDKPLVFVREQRMLFCDFETRRLGWFVRDVTSERRWRFVPRDDMMAIFADGGIPVAIDHAHDAETVERMEMTNARHLAENGGPEQEDGQSALRQ